MVFSNQFLTWFTIIILCKRKVIAPYRNYPILQPPVDFVCRDICRGGAVLNGNKLPEARNLIIITHLLTAHKQESRKGKQCYMSNSFHDYFLLKSPLYFIDS